MEEDEKLSRKVRDSVIPPGPKAIAEPEKELRFTRVAQARLVFVLSVVAFAVSLGVFILSTQDWGMDEPLLKGWWWLCLPGLVVSYWMIRLGLRCTRHAYIILSPLGVEIFPFFKARENLQVIYWSQVAEAEVKEGNLLLHFTEEKKSGVVVSLKPIPRGRHHLLEEAVLGVMENRDN
ncbi:MAG: hypothetical protein KJO79_07575 [Verrucomicrobiae bacterium]|nr:hypothetical protein [Verrucomicrobiae bacterium]NNJ87023.1 hypothetical protein [Akkermansiaceae bacterium]